jgi:hypothetical protein
MFSSNFLEDLVEYWQLYLGLKAEIHYDRVSFINGFRPSCVSMFFSNSLGMVVRANWSVIGFSEGLTILREGLLLLPYISQGSCR